MEVWSKKEPVKQRQKRKNDEKEGKNVGEIVFLITQLEKCYKLLKTKGRQNTDAAIRQCRDSAKRLHRSAEDARRVDAWALSRLSAVRRLLSVDSGSRC